MLATIAEQCSGSETSTSGSNALPLQLQLPRVPAASEPRISRGLRKCASTPVLSCCDDEDNGLEVYVATRPFQEFGGGVFKALPTPLRNGVRDAGICHFITIFRARDGSLHQFDFGPEGGDIHVARGPFAALLSKDRGARSVAGQVRESRLSSLPDTHMFVGTTRLSLADIRSFNSLHHARSYELHVNDCRHYVNSLVAYATGYEAAASRMLVHQWRLAKDSGAYRMPLTDRVVRLGHLLTDVANWGAVKAISQVTAAGLLALSGRNALGRLAAGRVGAGAAAKVAARRLAPAGAKALAPVRNVLVRKPVVTMGTAAVATYAASTAPAAREVATVGARVAAGMRTAVIAAASLAQAVGQRTATATQQVTAAASGAARGAARLVACQQVAPVAAGGGAARRWLAGGANPSRITLPSVVGGMNRAQRLALAITSGARR